MINEIQNNKKEDIFDRMMHLPVLRIFEPFYKKYKEALLYLFFGGVAVFLNLFLFAGIAYVFHINELLNNIICWVICVLFQFFTNRTWVFEHSVTGMAGFLKQMTEFFSGRFLTLVIEEVILAVFITWLEFNTIAVKLMAQIVVIVLNYVISKVWVFRK